MSNFVNLMDIIYPVGSIYQSMNATSPASSIGGTWTQLKTFLYGSTTAKNTGGEATHTLSIDEMPAHRHGDATWVYYAHLVNGGINRGHRLTWATDNSCSQNETFNKLTGGGKAHNNLPAYQNCYVWHRTA